MSEPSSRYLLQVVLALEGDSWMGKQNYEISKCQPEHFPCLSVSHAHTQVSAVSHICTSASARAADTSSCLLCGLNTDVQRHMHNRTPKGTC